MTTNAELRALLTEARKRPFHAPTCRSINWANVRQSCDCGLADFLARITAALAEKEGGGDQLNNEMKAQIQDRIDAERWRKFERMPIADQESCVSESVIVTRQCVDGYEDFK